VTYVGETVDFERRAGENGDRIVNGDMLVIGIDPSQEHAFREYEQAAVNLLRGDQPGTPGRRGARIPGMGNKVNPRSKTTFPSWQDYLCDKATHGLVP
jgi:hypothetical protein